MTLDATSDTVVVSKKGTRRAALNRARNTFRIANGVSRRELAAPQELREPSVYLFHDRSQFNVIERNSPQSNAT